MLKECRKCLKMVNISNFSQFIAVTKNGKEKRLRAICYDCNYKNLKRKAFNWKTATNSQKLDRLEFRFNQYAIKQQGCWDWKGFVRPDGYTRMKWHDRFTSLGGHVVSWMIHNKQINLNGLFVLHKCDNRKCTNPKHLFLGTTQDNMADMVKKGRCRSKLTVIQVKNIKRLLNEGIPQSKLAKKYKVNYATIKDIKKNVTWKHIII